MYKREVIIKIKIFIVFIVAIIAILTMSPWINFDSNINSIYQSIVKQMTIGIAFILLISGYYLISRKIIISVFGKLIYVVLILCVVSGIKYCIDIYNAPTIGVNIQDLYVYRSRVKKSYYEIDLSSETNIKQSILFAPTSYDANSDYDRCIVYINDTSKDIDLNSIYYYRDIVINEGVSFMILGIDSSNTKEAIKKIETTVETLKKDETITEAILMGEEKGADVSLLTSISNSDSINGVIALYPSENSNKYNFSDKKVNIPVLLIQDMQSSSMDDKLYKIIKSVDKQISYIKLPGNNDKFNDMFIETSIIGDKFKEEFTNWIRMDI